MLFVCHRYVYQPLIVFLKMFIIMYSILRWLAGNSFNGSIPSQIGSLQNLSEMYASNSCI